MSIKSIKIKNLLSFDELIIDNFEDINCIVGKNNAGKSNLLKLLRYFYNKLDEKRELSPLLYSDYSSFGTITIYYDISHIKKIVTADKNISNKKLGYFKEIYNLLILNNDSDTFELTLKIYANESIEWSIKDKKTRKIIADIYPFFDIEARHIDLYDWNKLWVLVSRMKPFNPHKVKQEDVIEFFDEKLNNSDSENYKNYEKYIKIIEDNLETGSYNYSQKVLSFVKSGLKGQSFLIGQEGLETQSDGTNSHKFIETFISLLILLTRKAYITPILYIDEPEVGLHPKRNEELIENIYETYKKVESKTPYPTIILTTHSPNIVKQVIKLFGFNQQILHFSKKEIEDKKNGQNKYFKIEPTVVQQMNSQYDDPRFLNVFSDNEARLFFSNFILFVEGETELEIFRNRMLINKFENLKYIDVYATNKVVFKYINPSYSNTSIPYLSIYDLDKFFTIDLGNKNIIFRDEIINFSQLSSKYCKSYPSYQNKNSEDKEYTVFKSIKFYFNFINNAKLNIKDNIFIDTISNKGINYYFNSLIDFTNKKILQKDNIFVNRTTIEEVLINTESLKFLKKWLWKYLIKMELNTERLKKAPFIAKRKKKKQIVKKVKKIIEQEKEYFLSINEELVLYLLLFNGKTPTLVSIKNKNFSLINCELKDSILRIKEEIQKSFPTIQDLFGKTSGWTTKFLNFSIEEIEKNKNDEEFRKEFKKYFGELYDIITIIEEKLDFDR